MFIVTKCGHGLGLAHSICPGSSASYIQGLCRLRLAATLDVREGPKSTLDVHAEVVHSKWILDCVLLQVEQLVADRGLRFAIIGVGVRCICFQWTGPTRASACVAW